MRREKCEYFFCGGCVDAVLAGVYTVLLVRKKFAFFGVSFGMVHQASCLVHIWKTESPVIADEPTSQDGNALDCYPEPCKKLFFYGF